MRIASANAFESALGNLQRRQQALSELQQQLTSGKRVQKVSDDPTAAATAARALANETRTVAHERALQASSANMALAEGSLGDAGELLQQARELTVSAGNGTYKLEQRAVIAQQLESLRNDLLALANRRDPDGRALFGGVSSTLNGAAFVDDGTSVTYQALATPRELQSAAAPGDQIKMPLTLDGEAIWGIGDDPVAPGNALNVFSALDELIDRLRDPALQDSAAVAQNVSDALTRIDALSANMASWRSFAGDALSTSDRLESQLSQTKLDAKTQRSEAEDLDLLEAISDFQNQQTGYDAAMKTYSMVQRMSLFDYIK